MKTMNNNMQNKKKDLPAMPFYFGDWRKAPEIRALDLDVRMIWFEMLGLMWESTERGYLTLNGKPVITPVISRMLGVDLTTLERALAQLEEFNVFSRRDDGAIYSRKMAKDEADRLKKSIAGKAGMKIRYNGSVITPDITSNIIKPVTSPEIEGEEVIKPSLKENKSPERRRSPFVIPTIQEVRKYFSDNGFDPDFGETRWHYYNDANWFDSHGNPVLNWKQKMRSVWFKPEHKINGAQVIPVFGKEGVDLDNLR